LCCTYRDKSVEDKEDRMETHDTPKQDKQITVAVPEERVPEFYAFYGRFLAAEGLAFGAYLVAGQTYIAEHTTRETRGAAIGVYATYVTVTL